MLGLTSRITLIHHLRTRHKYNGKVAHLFALVAAAGAGQCSENEPAPTVSLKNYNR